MSITSICYLFLAVLNDVQFYFPSPVRPADGFYDLREDPPETVGLGNFLKPEHAIAPAEPQDILHRWILETNDKGRFPDSENAPRDFPYHYILMDQRTARRIADAVNPEGRGSDNVVTY